DHMRRRTIKMSDIQVAVLDEADEMLNMGFIDDIKDILKGIPKERQTLLFSATMPKQMREIETLMMNNTKEIKKKTKKMTIDIIKGIPKERQTLLFSTTMPKQIREIATTMMNNPKEIKTKSKEMTVENIKQSFIEIPDRFKFDTLTNHFDINAPKLAIVFTRT